MNAALHSKYSLCALACVFLCALASCDDGGGGEDTSSDVLADADTRPQDMGPACGFEQCTETERCCDYACVDVTNNPDHCGACGATCADAETCVDGQCICGGEVCAEGEGCCEERCVRLASDAAHCGACGITCGASEVCHGGRCACLGADGQLDVCSSHETCCAGSGCRDLERDPRSCGGCGLACGPGELCVDGACACGNARGALGETACAGEEACCGSPATCRPVDDPECECGTALCGSGQSCCEIDDGNGPVETCVSTWRDTDHCGMCGAACGAGQRCRGGLCDCQEGLSDCNGDPADGCEAVLAVDTEHCGGCGAACAQGELCDGTGVCALNCQAGLTNCDGECVDLDWDREHCGACGNACAPGEVANGAGVCTATCRPGLTVCDGQCVDLLRNRIHCGACGVACGPGEVCGGLGACTLTCQPGLVSCGHQCVDLTSNNRHCGACGNPCGEGQVCSDGRCAANCQSSHTDCGGQCVDTRSDFYNCGACGAACAAGEICDGGTCRPNCTAEQTECDGRCVDLDRDRLHCGACGNACTGQQQCVFDSTAGTASCVLDCPAGVTACGDVCADLDRDASHCGACDNACAQNEACFAGVCCDAVDGCAGQVAAITAGRRHACLLDTNGHVWCWGRNHVGQIGNESNAPAHAPVRIELTAGTPLVATDVAAGAEHTCAVDESGVVYCWGSNVAGQLGKGDLVPAFSPEQVDATVWGARRATALAAGDAHTCALLDDRTVWCWGADANGQIGDGIVTLDGHPRPVQASISSALQLTAGAQHTCATHTGPLGVEVSCWGDASLGQLGDGCGASCPSSQPSPQPVVLDGGGQLTSVVSLAAGAHNTCAVNQTGELFCWGDGETGLTGCTMGTSCPADDTATPIVPSDTSLGDVLDVALGEGNACLAASSGAVGCWGQGLSSAFRPPGPGLGQPCSGLDPASACTHTAAEPVVVSGADGSQLASIETVAAGIDFACGLGGDGNVQCWGWDDFGQLGDGDSFAGPATPVRLDAALSVEAVRSTNDFTCGLATGAGVYCWGLNRAYGDPNTGAAPAWRSPWLVPGTTTATDVAVGLRHACAVLGDGSVVCWGDDADGQLGDGTSMATMSPEPVTVSGLDGTGPVAVEITAGEVHSCARLDTGEVRCWGQQQSGALGNGATTSAAVDTPVMVTGLDGSGPATSAVAVGAGDAWTCALLEDASVVCWGFLWGSNSEAGTPTSIDTLDGQTVASMALAVGTTAACVIDGGSAVLCWGQDSFGLLGEGGVVTGTPAVVAGLDGVTQGAVQVDVNQHGCVVMQDGSIRCWGRGDEGQLGDGGASSRVLAVTASNAGFDGVDALADQVEVGFQHTCAIADGTPYCWGRPEDGQLGDGSAGRPYAASIALP